MTRRIDATASQACLPGREGGPSTPTPGTVLANQSRHPIQKAPRCVARPAFHSLQNVEINPIAHMHLAFRKCTGSKTGCAVQAQVQRIHHGILPPCHVRLGEFLWDSPTPSPPGRSGCTYECRQRGACDSVQKSRPLIHKRDAQYYLTGTPPVNSVPLGRAGFFDAWGWQSGSWCGTLSPVTSRSRSPWSRCRSPRLPRA